jgi:hypothetical protein
MIQINVRRFEGGNDSFKIKYLPSECPYCHRSVIPQRFEGYKLLDSEMAVIYQCPDSRCQQIFIAYYQTRFNGGTSNWELNRTSIGNIKGKNFATDIKTISPTFITIYNQALKAEMLGLDHVCGIGYRKALEFLLKDYLILLYPEKEEEIRNKFLGNCIKEYIDNPNLKDMTQRAIWLGNDETHYSRKWDNKDVSDLKLLIDVSLHWIEMEMLTKKYKEEMQ